MPQTSPPSSRRRLMHLGAFVHETGQHVAAWRHPEAHAESGVSFAQAVEVAQIAERGKFDFLFLADTAAVSLSGSAESRGRMGKVVKFEPMTLLAALAAVTKHLGLVATSTTTFNEPYTLARQFASLDQISGGRSGWNLVTSNNEGDARNYSRAEHPAHVELIVGVGDDVAEPRRPSEAGGQRLVDDAGAGEAAERLRIGRRRPEVPAETRRDREIDHDLDGLPQVEDHGVRRVRRGPQLGVLGGQALGNPREMAAHRHGALGEEIPVEGAHRRRRASTWA